jgi:hypothetical protein
MCCWLCIKWRPARAPQLRVFEKFDELGTARQVFVWWREQALPFPVRQAGFRSRPVVWVKVSYRAILGILHHPFYAGAYVFGRSETRRELDPHNPQRVVARRGQRGREEWPVLIRDHHSGYISFEKYLENQERIRDNEVMGVGGDEGRKGAVREGRALLQGLVRCGHCGRRMMVGYGGARAKRTLQYRCRRPDEYSRRECQEAGRSGSGSVESDQRARASPAAERDGANARGEARARYRASVGGADDDGARPQAPAAMLDRGGAVALAERALSRHHRLEGGRHYGARAAPLRFGRAGPRDAPRHSGAGTEAGDRVRRRADREDSQSSREAQRIGTGARSWRTSAKDSWRAS